jgi:multicomponent Na+:H+ antiporter subunit B
VSRRARGVLFGGAAVLLGALLVWAVAQLPDPSAPPPRSAKLSTSVSLHERHVTDTVGGVTFDLRGLDTLGEELILFVAAVGSSVLLRAQRDPDAIERAAQAAEQRRPRTAGALRALGAVLVAPVLVLGGYIVTHGHLTPGGGFQGGVILAGTLLLVYAAGQVVALERVRPLALVELADALGAAAFALVAVGGLVFASAAMANFLALGVAGHFLSGGTIFVLELAVGVEVTGALALVLSELVDQALLREA